MHKTFLKAGTGNPIGLVKHAGSGNPGSPFGNDVGLLHVKTQSIGSALFVNIFSAQNPYTYVRALNSQHNSHSHRPPSLGIPGLDDLRSLNDDAAASDLTFNYPTTTGSRFSFQVIVV